MAFPCEKVESLFRNNIADVIKFLDLRHLDHYKVYNICSERSYDPKRFHRRVATYPFDEDNPPPFELIKPFCEDVDIWLNSNNDQNVAVIHCDDGVGRTGVMITSYLLHDRQFDTAKDALQFYGEARTQTAKGVTIPSQRRYVQYYGYLVRNQLTYVPITVLLERIRLEGIPHFGSGGCSLRFAVYLYKTRVFVSKVFETNKRTTDKFLDLSLDQPVPLCGDIKIVFYNKRKRIFRFWLNTYFVDMHQDLMSSGESTLTTTDTRLIVLPKAELDKANKDTKHYPPNFQVCVMIKKISDDHVIESSDHAVSDYEEDDEEDLSDTDPEDEWEPYYAQV